jgi:FixJ family two-component response regulator
MPATVFVISPQSDERKWVEATLVLSVSEVVFVDDGPALLAQLPVALPACLVTAAEPDAGATLQLVRDLRERGAMLPVIVLGPHSAFRIAVDIARLPATDFLERPVSKRQLRLAVIKALRG